MASIKLLRKSVTYDKDLLSYRMIVYATLAENITSKVFVNQRLRNMAKQNFDDTFVAVATPAQIADFGEDAPLEGSSYFRTDKIDVVSRNADYLDSVFDDILYSVQKLVEDTEALNDLHNEGLYTITAEQIEVSPFFSEQVTGGHTHYRVPLKAEPCGTNDTFNDAGTMRQRIGSQNTSLRGWLNSSLSPTYPFKYNIATDPVLSTLFPIPTNKVAYAHLIVNGITISGVQITETDIYWAGNEVGQAPWPSDWVSTASTGSTITQLTIVLDFII